LPLLFVSDVLAVDGASDGAAKLRLCQLVLPVLCSGDDGFVFSCAKRVSFFSPPNNSRRFGVRRRWLGGVLLLHSGEGM